MIEIEYVDTQEIDQKVTGMNIRLAREELDLSQIQLAKAMKCTKAYVSHLELGKGCITARKIGDIDKALKEADRKRRMGQAKAACDEYQKTRSSKMTAGERCAFVNAWLMREGE